MIFNLIASSCNPERLTNIAHLRGAHSSDKCLQIALLNRKDVAQIDARNGLEALIGSQSHLGRRSAKSGRYGSDSDSVQQPDQ